MAIHPALQPISPVIGIASKIMGTRIASKIMGAVTSVVNGANKFANRAVSWVRKPTAGQFGVNQAKVPTAVKNLQKREPEHAAPRGAVLTAVKNLQKREPGPAAPRGVLKKSGDSGVRHMTDAQIVNSAKLAINNRDIAVLHKSSGARKGPLPRLLAS